MKTSLEISDAIFKRIKAVARKRGTSVRALVEEGLRLLLEIQENRADVKPKLLTFGGDGLTDKFQGTSLTWDSIREEVYKGHGI